MNGYISIEIGGKKRGLKFGMLAVPKIGEAALKLQNDDVLSSQLAVEMFYWGMVNNCVVKQTDQDFTYEDVTNWVEEMWFDEQGQEAIKAVLKTFSESKVVTNGAKLLDSLDDETKKKMVELFGIKSSHTPLAKSDSYQATTTA